MKIDDATKTKAVADFLAKRRTAKEIAEELGVTPTAVRQWARDAASKVMEAQTAPTPMGGPFRPAASGPTGDVGGGHDAARKAAGLPPKTTEKPSPLDDDPNAKPTDEKKPEEIPPIPPDEAVGLAEMALFLTTRGYCAANGIDMTDDVEAQCRLTEGERRHLRSVAPYAGKWLAIILAKFDLIGAALFIGGFVMILSTRISKLKKLKPKEIDVPPSDITVR